MKEIMWLRRTGIAEGVSFLVLLLVAMPLKYWANWPWGVKYIGWIHGLLFVLFVAQAYYVKTIREWPFKKFLLAFIAAWIPLGTFLFDRELKKEWDSLSGNSH
jgi:integral membrane protein